MKSPLLLMRAAFALWNRASTAGSSGYFSLSSLTRLRASFSSYPSLKGCPLERTILSSNFFRKNSARVTSFLGACSTASVRAARMKTNMRTTSDAACTLLNRSLIQYHLLPTSGNTFR